MPGVFLLYFCVDIIHLGYMKGLYISWDGKKKRYLFNASGLIAFKCIADMYKRINESLYNKSNPSLRQHAVQEC